MTTSIVPASSASPLRQRLIADMTMRRFSHETQRNCQRDAGRLASFLGRLPDTASARGPAPLPDRITGGRYRRADDERHRLGAAPLLHPHGRPADLVRKLVRLRYPRSLPDVLSPDEVCRLFGAAVCLKHLAALSVSYGANWRAAEAARCPSGEREGRRRRLHPDANPSQLAV